MDLRDHVVYYTNEEIIPIKPLKVIEPVSCEAIYRNLPVKFRFHHTVSPLCPVNKLLPDNIQKSLR